MSDQFLFTRRTFLQSAAVASAGVAFGGLATAKDGDPVKFGSGKATYTLDENWGKLPAGMTYGYGCAIVVDSKDRIYVTSRTDNACVVIFDQQGKILETWVKDIKAKLGYDQGQYKATAHGLYWSKEGNQEFLYWTENVAAPKGQPKIGARVYKTDLNGKVLFTIGNVEKKSDTAKPFDFKNPTDVAVAANGDIYVVDGYGSQLVHRFDKNFELIKTIGGPGKEHGKFNTCHGVWVSTLKKEPEIYIADRGNARLEVYSMDLEYKRTVAGVKNPCCFYQHDGQLFVPDLASRLSVFDENDKLVTHLGDGAALKDRSQDSLNKNQQVFATPHAMTLDSKGDIYVLEWLPFGRVRKLKHTPA